MTVDPDYALFARIVAAGSLSAAARAMRLSPAMVSKRLARLEDRLGVRLVHRTTRRLTLTTAGAAFHEDVLAILEAIRVAEERVTGGRREPSGPLRVSAPTSFGRLHVAPRIAAFLALHPRVELELLVSDAYVDLAAERIDVAVRITDTVPAGLDARRLATNRRILVASPAYLARHGTPARLAALSDHRLLAADGQWPWRLVNGTQRRQVDGRSHVRTNSSEIVRELALAGIGIALRSLWDIDGALATGALVRVLDGWAGSSDLGLYAMHPKGAGQPAAARAFIDFLSAAYDPVPWDAAPPP